MRRYREGKTHYKPITKKPKFSSLTDLLNVYTPDEYDDGKGSQYINEIKQWQKERLENQGWYLHGIEDKDGYLISLHTHGLFDTSLNQLSPTVSHYEFRINWVDTYNFDLAVNLISLLAEKAWVGMRFEHNNYFKYEKSIYLLREGRDDEEHGEYIVLDIICLGNKTDGEVRNIVTLLERPGRFPSPQAKKIKI